FLHDTEHRRFVERFRGSNHMMLPPSTRTWGSTKVDRDNVPVEPELHCVIRNSRDEDMARIHAIYGFHVHHGLASFEEEPPSVEELNRRRADVLNRGLPYLVAETGGVVVGYTYAAPYRSRPAYRFTVENSVYVDDSLRRQGVGYLLLSALISRCIAGQYRQ